MFSRLDWSVVPERDPHRPWPGRPPHPTAAYVKALLVKVGEGKASVTDLRRFLPEHPLLVLELGFRPVVDLSQPWGVDVARTVPGERWLRHQQQTRDERILHRLLARTVAAGRQLSPTVGTTIAVDIKHIYAWVRETNPREAVPHRFDPARQPRGDRDCRLGAKRLVNQDRPAGQSGTEKEYLWGYGTGIATATDPLLGDVVLAAITRPFNDQDVAYFQPLYRQTVATLGQAPTNLAAAAAFAAWHVDQTCADQGGIAAIPRNRRGPAPARDAAAGRYATAAWP